MTASIKNDIFIWFTPTLGVGIKRRSKGKTLAKTYDNSGTESGPRNAPATTPYAKFIPIVVGLLVLLLMGSLFMRSRTTQNTAPGATTGANESTGPAVRPNGAGPQER